MDSVNTFSDVRSATFSVVLVHATENPRMDLEKATENDIASCDVESVYHAVFEPRGLWLLLVPR